MRFVRVLAPKDKAVTKVMAVLLNRRFFHNLNREVFFRKTEIINL
jgi:hypothetical protein